MSDTFDASAFRKIMGHYPTGICAITAIQPSGVPAAMIVGSFTSVSLHPPLVAFFPDKSSSSWPKIEAAGRFCVNVLSDQQEELCRLLATKDADKFNSVSNLLSPLGSPVVDGAIAWIDCMLHAVHEAGDHYFVLGAVHSQEVQAPGAPLLFHKGAYARLAKGEAL